MALQAHAAGAKLLARERAHLDFAEAQRAEMARGFDWNASFDALCEEVKTVVTVACPRCKTGYLSFVGCASLTCTSCGCRFCAYCHTDCGNNAHPHVRDCLPRLQRSGKIDTFHGGYFTTEEVWRTYHHREKARQLERLFAKVPAYVMQPAMSWLRSFIAGDETANLFVAQSMAFFSDRTRSRNLIDVIMGIAEKSSDKA